MDKNGHVFGPHSDLCLNCGCDRPGFFFGGRGSQPCPGATQRPLAITHEIAIARCYELSENSPCFKAKFGSVVVNDGVIVGEGWNHSPNPACQDCEHQCAGGIRQGIASGTRVELCHAGHAEGWAITDAGRLAREGLIYIAGTDVQGNKFLKDHTLPLGNPRAGFYCTLCIRHIWMAGLSAIYVDSVVGIVKETLEQAWASSYGVAAAGAAASR